MDWKEVIENLKYLISEDCTDTQFDYADEIEIAIRVMESQEDLRSKIDKAIEVFRKEIEENHLNVIDYADGEWLVKDFIYGAIDRLKRNIGE